MKSTISSFNCGQRSIKKIFKVQSKIFNFTLQFEVKKTIFYHDWLCSISRSIFIFVKINIDQIIEKNTNVFLPKWKKVYSIPILISFLPIKWRLLIINDRQIRIAVDSKPIGNKFLFRSRPLYFFDLSFCFFSRIYFTIFKKSKMWRKQWKAIIISIFNRTVDPDEIDYRSVATDLSVQCSIRSTSLRI